ncbi:MAG: PVC-type heme-binding CxxCH protein [Planctomyces sp.]
MSSLKNLFSHLSAAVILCAEASFLLSGHRVLMATDERRPADAVAGLDVSDGLECTLFAAEPMLFSPSNIDVDHLGRVWVCEVVNYRRFANADNPDRPEGDRILVLEDTDHDGVADKQHVFYQGRDIDSAHGVCVLGNRVIVSAGDSVFSLYDDNADLKADRKEILFTGIQGTQHDHGIHSFLFGPDGRLYFNFGNSGKELHYPDGSIVRDLAGNEVRADRKPYQEGMAFRCEPDGTSVETLGWNFRNNWELCVDSFGGIWQSDNDDDGNRGVRINFLMEFGNYGYKDELTGASWRTPRANLESEIPLQHWHLNDPGVVPNLIQTGAGSPTGILIYEGSALPERFRDQLIHCDAGPNIVRSYAVSDSGAGYTATINDILSGTRDQWFRPSDVCAAPDGSLIIADWYDPGVGGHRQGDVERGRLFRVATKGSKWSVPSADLKSVPGALAALRSPNSATRYLAFEFLRENAADAQSLLGEMFRSDPNPRFRARAMWLLGMIPGNGQKIVNQAITDENRDIRAAGIRLARRLRLDIVPVIRTLSQDTSPQVRRECAIAIRNCKDPERIAVWKTLAEQYDGSDRWYLEALGIAAQPAWSDFLTDADLSKLANDVAQSKSSGNQSASARHAADLIRRSRSSGSATAIIELIALECSGADRSTDSLQRMAGLFRALDFQSPEGMSGLVIELLREVDTTQLTGEAERLFLEETLRRVEPGAASDPTVQKAVGRSLECFRDTDLYVSIARRFRPPEALPGLVELVRKNTTEQSGFNAASAVIEQGKTDLLTEELRKSPPAQAVLIAELIGKAATPAIVKPLLSVIQDDSLDMEVRRVSIRALSSVNEGDLAIAELAAQKTLPEELTPAVAAALHSSAIPEIRNTARKLFPLPASQDNHATPPITELIGMKGDTTKGRLVFFTNGTCHKCHVVGDMGREIGPNLTEIGSKLSPEAMFESILFPSAGISHNFESWTVVLSNGTSANGILVSQTDDAVSIKGDDALTRTFSRTEIDELVKQKISLMPADLTKTMSPQDIADVVAYMKTLKKPR